MGKKKLTITLHKSELVYDFQNKAFLTGRSRRTDENTEQASNMQASDDEEDKNQALRSIQTAYSSLLGEISEGLFGCAQTNTVTNELMEEDGNLTLCLQVPSNFILALKETVCSSIHDYIVNRALMEWFLITDKTDAAEYGELAKASLARLRQTMFKRERPTRKEVD